jgi:hypothetical protein
MGKKLLLANQMRLFKVKGLVATDSESILGSTPVVRRVNMAGS